MARTKGTKKVYGKLKKKNNRIVIGDVNEFVKPKFLTMEFIKIHREKGNGF